MAKKARANTKSGINLVLFGLAAVTLTFVTSLRDPFNAPKMWLLFLFGAWFLGQIKGELIEDIKRKSLNSSSKIILAILTSFLVFNLLALLMTDDKYIGLFGDYQRRTGFLTYLCLVLFFWITSIKIRFRDGVRFSYWIFAIAFIFCSYSLFQNFGYDFVRWNNPYDAILGTVGNPNFAAALMGIFSVILFGFAINSETASSFRSILFISVVLIFLTIYYSDSLQGFLAAAVGIGVLISTWVWQRNKILGWSVFGLGFTGGLMSIFGILQIGPLSFLFKESVTYRGDYWRAGIRMLQENLWFGVGLDRYGAYFKEYRDAAQALRRGPEIGTNAAHNVFIQLGATGGIFVLLSYVVLIGFIFWRGIVGLRESVGTRQILFVTFFGAWLTYLAQSIISIDNIGVAIWGWVLGGAVVGLSYNKDGDARPKRTKSAGGVPFSLVFSSFYLIIALSFSYLFFTAERAQQDVGRFAPPNNVAAQAKYEEFVTKPLTIKPIEPRFRFMAAQFFFKARMNDQAVEQLKQAIDNDPREYNSRTTLADFYEKSGKPELALPIREYLVTIDPYNPMNLLALGRDLKATGDIEGARAIVEKIAAFAPESEELKSAKSEFLA